MKSLYKRLLPLRTRIHLRHRIIGLRAFVYRGNTVSCVCCGGTFSRFAPFGVVPRPNAACPKCDSMERHRFMLYYLQQHTDWLTQPLRVLHFAPEICLEPHFRASPWQYITADIAEGLADTAFDIQKIPFPDQSFDLIICAHVTGYVLNEDNALRELLRVLRPQGKLLLSTRIHLHTAVSFSGGDLLTDKRVTAYGLDPWVQWVHGTDYAQILQRIGFTVTIVRWQDLVTPAFAEKHGFNSAIGDVFDSECIFVCTPIAEF